MLQYKGGDDIWVNTDHFLSAILQVSVTPNRNNSKVINFKLLE